ncbi:MAG: hypothetical protein VB138_00480 [Burkholderia sp.]
MSARVLVLDAHGALEQALCACLAAAGARVLAHRREPLADEPPPGVRGVCDADPAARLAAWDAEHGSFDTIVLGQPRDTASGSGTGGGFDAGFALGCAAPASDTFEAFAQRLDTRLADFLATLQAAAVLLRRGGNAQIWALTQEDSSGYYLDTAPGALPVDVRARHAAIRSLGKEMLRLGVKVNAAHLQPVAEAADASAWSDAREGLKAFALRFKPNRAAAVAGALAAWIAREDLPVAGMVVPIGIGFTENNL